MNEVVKIGDTNLYRIGELAKHSHLSPRTIDYYTSIGLIRPEARSIKNYRLYSHETLRRLERIEWMKKEKYSLEEIKQSLDQWGKVANQEKVTQRFTALQIHLQQLEREVKEMSSFIEELKPQQAKTLFKNLAPQSAACIEALMLLLGKGPFT